MKKIIPIVLLLAAAFWGCKKSSDTTQSNTTTGWGTGSLNEQQTMDILVGDWKYDDSVTTNYYDRNNTLLATVKSVNSFPYWGITQWDFEGAIHCRILASDNAGLNPSSGGGLSVADITLFNGVTTLTIDFEKYVITSISSSQMNITNTLFKYADIYILDGKAYIAESANQKLTFTKYK